MRFEISMQRSDQRGVLRQSVTAMAKKSANFLGRMIMVNAQLKWTTTAAVLCGLMLIADRALSVLGIEHLFVLPKRYSVQLQQTSIADLLVYGGVSLALLTLVLKRARSATCIATFVGVDADLGENVESLSTPTIPIPVATSRCESIGTLDRHLFVVILARVCALAFAAKTIAVRANFRQTMSFSTNLLGHLNVINANAIRGQV